jgi:hypothetical protein
MTTLFGFEVRDLTEYPVWALWDYNKRPAYILYHYIGLKSGRYLFRERGFSRIQMLTPENLHDMLIRGRLKPFLIDCEKI